MQTKYTWNPFKGETAAGDRIFFARLPRRLTSFRFQVSRVSIFATHSRDSKKIIK